MTTTAIALCGLALVGPRYTHHSRPPPRQAVTWHRGLASWYEMGTQTANGERYLPDGLTCAHRTLRFGTRLAVRYRGREVRVRVNDRGPIPRDRVLDLSRGAARRIGLHGPGVGRVEWRVLR